MKKLLSLVLICALLCSLTGCKATDYKKALAAMDNGDYAAASEAFYALGDYKDSADLALTCDYRLAERLADRDELLEAAKAFDALGDYSDAAERADECRYDYAADLMKNRDRLLEAADVFEALGSFSNAAERAEECRYECAMDRMEAEDFDGAISLLEALGDYSDSAEKLQLAKDTLLLRELEGSWAADSFSYGTLLAEEVAKALSGEADAEKALSYLDFSDFMLDYQMDITGNTARVEVDAEKLAVVEETVKAKVVSGTIAYMTDTFTEAFREAGYTLEQGLRNAKVESVEQLFEQSTGTPISEWTVQVYGLDKMFIASDYAFRADVTVENGVIRIDGDEAAYDGETLIVSATDGDVIRFDLTFRRA